MTRRLSIHSQLSSIIETMAKSTFSQVCKLVDQDTAELRSELSRLLFANSALAEKVNSLECELTCVRGDTPKKSRSYCSVGVQTVSCRDEEHRDETCPPTIEGIFGKDWCINLWKDRDPSNLQRCIYSPGSPDKPTATLLEHVTVDEIKEEELMSNAATNSDEKTICNEEHKESMAEESDEQSADYSVDVSTCSFPLDQDGHQVEDNEEDDDVQFVQASLIEAASSPAVGPSHDEQQTLPTNSNENCPNPGRSFTKAR
ncbi:hypothetical protein CHARACLAT_006816 [Characodon lateralis]|uniref:Uncharacterized protein n=1 Tax=Characodon lateralis TaxID=208331 RepID=A0ABU7F0R4_9TELE|nr:hypothetical protein [Characodon lateralis]